MKKSLLSCVGAVALAMGGLFAGSAMAAPALPASIAGQNIHATGDPVQAVYLYADAGDTSQLTVEFNGQFLFKNGPGGSAIGELKSISPVALNQLLTFTLTNTTFGGAYSTGVASTNVAYMTLTNNDWSVIDTALGLPLNKLLSDAAKDALDVLYGLYGSVTVIAFEDRPLANSDQDYNDLIFAFGQTRTTQEVPEPATLALMGIALAGLGVARRRRATK